ncbi:MAG: hypothetical protein ABI183_00485 [Polyangiaceae bacterium]
MNDWREAFVAMSVLLGEPVEAALAALDNAHDLPLAGDLQDHDKSRRALALSKALAPIALAAESLQMDVPS